MKARVAVLVCAGLVAVAAVLSAQSNVILNPDFEAKLNALDPSDAEGHFALAVSAFKDSLYEETKVAADRMLKIDAGDTRALYLKGAAEFYKSGKFKIDIAESDKPNGDKKDGGLDREPQVITLSDEEVDRVYTEYGDKVMGEFRTLQSSVLLRRCATDKCHGNTATSGPFYLKTQNTTDRKVMAENFKSVERYVSRANKDASVILAKALAEPPEHPGGPVFRNARDASYVRLKNWVNSLPGLWN